MWNNCAKIKPFVEIENLVIQLKIHVKHLHKNARVFKGS